MIDEDAIRLRWERVGARLDERGRRLFAAAEVRSAGRGGLALVSKITGLARSTINRGEDDLDGEPLCAGAGSARRSGAALTGMGHPISADTVGAELAKLGLSRQSNRKADEGSRIEKACAHGRSSLSRPIESSLVNKR